MKKLFIAMMALLLSVGVGTASAQQVSKKQVMGSFRHHNTCGMQAPKSLAEMVAQSVKNNVFSTPAPQNKAPRSVSAQDVAGTYIEASYNNMAYYACQDGVVISFPTENTISIYNLQGYGTTVTGTVNWSTGQLHFPHQIFLTTTQLEYNPSTDKYDIPITVDMYFDPDSANVTAGVRGQIYQDGSVVLDKWIAESYFPEDNAWDWVMDFDMASTNFFVANSKMTTTDVFNGKHEYNTFIYDADDEFSTIFGFAGKGALNLQRRNSGALIIRPEQHLLFWNFYYGYCSVYSPTYENQQIVGINTLRNIGGQGDEREWNIDAWAATFDLGNRVPEDHDPEWKTKSTTIVRTDGKPFTYPTAKDYGWDGEGSQQNPYLLKTAKDWETLNNVVQTGEYFDGLFFAMDNDVDFAGSTFQGVATGMLTTVSTNPRFAGTLDGRGHSIKNLRIIQPELNHIGLFGEVRGHIKNLIIDKSCEFLGYDYVGSFCGELKYSLDCSLIACENYANVTGVNAYIGGLAGQTAAGHIIQNCYNAGTVTGANCKVGGLVGYLFRSKMTTCQNAGLVQIKNIYPNNDPILSQVGGLTGYACGVTIDNCLNTATVDGAIATKVGGLCGEIYNSFFDTNIINSLNIGCVLSASQSLTGGIAAYNTSEVAYAKTTVYDASRVYSGAWQGDSFAGITAATTQTLISGSSSLGLDLTKRQWSVKPNMYPSLKVFDQKNEDWRQCYVLFAEGESAGDVQTSATIHADEAKLVKGGANGFEIKDMVLYAPVAGGMQVDTLILKKGEHTVLMPIRKLSSGVLAGDGTVFNPYLIGSVDEWNIFVREANMNAKDFKGQYLKLSADIDFTGAEFVAPYSDSNKQFCGTLDGDGHTISHVNMDLGEQSSSNTIKKGLIASIGYGGEVKNLTVSDSYFRGFENIGALVGQLEGQLTNCHTTKTVRVEAENRYAGGLVGNIEDGIVDGCSNSAEVYSEQFVGGIAGDARTTGALIRNTKNYGHITNIKENRPGVSNVAGFVARLDGKIENSENYGTIESDDDYAAGFVSQGYSTTQLKNCVNHGAVTAHANHRVMGYAAGILTDQGSAQIIGCGNTGRIISHLNYAGGISALCEGNITDCWNTGMVTADIVFAGGICGYTTVSRTAARGNFIRCWNAGEVAAGFSQTPATMSNFAGGIVGNTVEETPVLDECWNMGYIHVDKTPGPDGTSDYDAAFDYTNAGGLVGSGAAIIQNCANFGKVWSKKQTGGILGRLIDTGNGMIKQTYNAGVVLCPGQAEYAGHIMGDEFIDYSIDLPSVFFDADAVQQTFALDVNYNGLSREDMTATEGTITKLGNKFDYSEVAAYPMLKSFMTDDANIEYKHMGYLHHQLATATIFEDEESQFFLGNSKVVKWQGENVDVIAGIAFGRKVGETTLTASVDGVELNKEFKIEITHAWTDAEIQAYLGATGITSVASQSKQGKTFNLAGQQVGKTYRGVIIQNGKKVLK